MAETGIECVTDPFGGEARVPECELGLECRDRCVTGTSCRWALAGAHPSAPCYRAAYSQANKRRDACADDHVREARWIGTLVGREDTAQAQWRCIHYGDACIPVDCRQRRLRPKRIEPRQEIHARTTGLARRNRGEQLGGLR